MFGILGATRVLGADGAEVALGGPRRRALLALLLLDAGRVVTTERLVDALYGDEPPAGVGNAVQSQVSRLRQVLPAPLEGHPAGYRLAVDPDEVDAHRFQRLAVQGREALAAGDAGAGAGLLREALGLWRGPALADVGGAPFAAAQAVRLEELRGGAVEDRVEADLLLGRHRSLVAELGELVAAHPLRERLRGQLMRALYGSGRQSEALEAYESARRELADSLGADPGPELAAVHLAVLRGDPSLLPPPVAAPGPPPGAAESEHEAPGRSRTPGDVPRGTSATGDIPRETATAVHVPRETSSGEAPPAERDPAASAAAAVTATGSPLFPPPPPVPAPTPAVAPTFAPAPAHRTLPVQLTSFVGRDAELRRIGDQLARGRLVTLTGPGGAGKTRLAVQAAARHPHDVAFVELAAVAGGAELPRAVLGALGVREGGLIVNTGPAGPAVSPAAHVPPAHTPAGPTAHATATPAAPVTSPAPAYDAASAATAAGAGPGAGPGPGLGPDPVARIAAAVADRPLLLVLDNCEHVIEDAAVLAEALLTRAPRMTVLATSREPLGIPGEALCPIPPLPLPRPGADREQTLTSPAVRLFCERAAAVRPDFDPAADAATTDAVLRLCTALDGLPLAIELAAARLRSMSVAEIADRLGAFPADQAPYSLGVRPDALFRLLSRGSRTAQPRQRTLRGVVEWSWNLLPDEERTVLRRASVFAGGWTLAAAEAVCAAPPGVGAEDVLDLMAALVDKSLVVAQQQDGTGPVRYRMLESIRAYAAERLAEAGEAESARRAHAAYFLDFALEADPHLRRAEQLRWLRLLSDERDNSRAAMHRALDAGDVATAMRLIAALSSYWLLRGLRSEGAGPARRVLAALGPNPPQGMEEEYALCVMAVIGTVSDAEDFTAHVAAVTRVVDAMHRVSRQYPVLTLLWAPFAGAPGEEVDTVAVLEEFLNGRDDPWYRALGHLGAGFQAWMVSGDVETGRRECRAALEGFRRVGDRWGLITSMNALADLADYRGDVAEATALLDQALLLAEELDSTLDIADLLSVRAGRSLRAGDLDAAVESGERAADLSRRAGSPETLALALLGLAEAARMRGDLAAARELSEQALEECPTGWFSANSVRGSVFVVLGRIAVAEGDAAAARARFRDAAAAEMLVLRYPLIGSSAAEAVARLALLENEPRQAAALLGAAEALRGNPPTGPDAAATAAAAREALGEADYAAAHAEAAALDRDAAVALLTGYIADR